MQFITARPHQVLTMFIVATLLLDPALSSSEEEIESPHPGTVISSRLEFVFFEIFSFTISSI